MTVKLMPVGTPTVNDRVYPADVVHTMINQAKERIDRRTLFVHRLREPHADPSPQTVIGTVDRLFIDEGFLHADITLLPGKSGDFGDFTLNCIGYLTEEKPPKVYDAMLSHVLTVDPRYWNPDATLVSSRPPVSTDEH